MEACTALLPPEVAEQDAQRGAVVAAAAEPAAQLEAGVAAAELVAQQEGAAAEPVAQQEVAAAEPVAQQEGG
ncbi:MAG: hypothetical protein JWP51_5417, partial [Bradyrhizobium sp.]|nr:hypothetical protein [Bradyrhizobium sp.]